MSDPGVALQTAMAARLLADTGVSGLVGEGVYSQVEPKAAYPYLRIGDDQIIGDGTECLDSSEVYSRVHVWANDADRTVTAKRLAGAVRACLATEFPLDGFEIVEAQFQDSQHLDDPERAVAHSIVTVRYLIDPA